MNETWFLPSRSLSLAKETKCEHRDRKQCECVWWTFKPDAAVHGTTAHRLHDWTPPASLSSTLSSLPPTPSPSNIFSVPEHLRQPFFQVVTHLFPLEAPVPLPISLFPVLHLFNPYSSFRTGLNLWPSPVCSRCPACSNHITLGEAWWSQTQFKRKKPERVL